MTLFVVFLAVASVVRIVAVVFSGQLSNYLQVAHAQRHKELASNFLLFDAIKFGVYIWSHQDEGDAVVRKLKKRTRVADACSWVSILLAVASTILA